MSSLGENLPMLLTVSYSTLTINMTALGTFQDSLALDYCVLSQSVYLEVSLIRMLYFMFVETNY